MQRPCAYCREYGHHIRNCKELSEKNRKSHIPTPVSKIEIKSNPINIYASIYNSSDDEVEEGEIVEDDRIRKPTIAVVSDSDSDSEQYFETVPQNSNKWTRSGIKATYIPPVVIEHEPQKDESLDCDYNEVVEYIAEVYIYYEKYKGRSWVDIEYDSDNE